jgi:hypothetical protein
MLIAVFFAVFAVSILYLGIGAGEAVLYREHLQDAADSAALSGAITHARIMNIIVLTNVVMSALLAVLVTIKLVEGAAIVGTVIAAGLAWLTAGGSLIAIPPLNAIRANMSALYEEVKEPIFSALEMLHDTAQLVADAAPEASDAVVQADVGEVKGTLVTAGFAAPTAKALPVQDDSYEELCGKAGEFPVQMAKTALGGLPGMSEVLGALESPMGTMTKSLSAWFCGDGENSVPNLDQTVEKAVQPRSEKSRACETETLPPRDPSAEKDAQSVLCEAAEAEIEDAKPGEDGGCQPGHDCSTGGPYDRAVTKAREVCDPSGSPKPKAYRYQTQGGSVVYTWDGTRWVRGEPKLLRGTVNEEPTNVPPCGTIRNFDSVSFNYNRIVHSADHPQEVRPVCSSEVVPNIVLPRSAKGTTKTVGFTQITHVLSCERKEKIRVPVTDSRSPGKVDENTKSPKRVRGDAQMGGEVFQVRSLMLGSTEQRESQRLVRLAQWGNVDPANPLENVRKLGGFSFAQGEYFYDDAQERSAWMWNMKWRARLVRFSMPTEDEAKEGLTSACSDHLEPGTCNKLLDTITEWNELLIH